MMQIKESNIVLKDITNFNLLEKYFNNGLDYIFYCCLSSQSIDLLTSFIIKIKKTNETSIDSIINGKKFEKESFVNNKQLIQSQIKNFVDTNDKFKYFSVLLKLCADLKDFFILIELIIESKFDINLFLSQHEIFISDEILLKKFEQPIID